MNRAIPLTWLTISRPLGRLTLTLTIALALLWCVVPAAAQDSSTTHTVQAGENLYRIALQYGLTVADLLAHNDISNPSRIYAGQVLIIPVDSTSDTDLSQQNAAVNPAPDTSIYHTVQAGQTLISIAEQYNMDWLDIAAANGLGEPNSVIVGQKLLIPSAVSTIETSTVTEDSPVASAETTPPESVPVGDYYIPDQVAAINPPRSPENPNVSPGDSSATASSGEFYIPDQVAAVSPVSPPFDLGILPVETVPEPQPQPVQVQPAAVSAPAASSPNPIITASGERRHVVQPGEHLASIAAQYGLTYPTLVVANNISDPNTVYWGQTLIIPDQDYPPGTYVPQQQPAPAANTTNAASNPAASSGERRHVVQPGEHLSAIAAQYGLSYPTLAMANNLSNPNQIYHGQTLIIPDQDYARGSYTPQAAAPVAAPTVTTGKQIIVDLSDQRVYLYEDGVLLRNVLVSTGTATYPTVQGNFKIYLKYESQTMSGPGYSLPGVPYVLYFYKAYSLHGTYWHSNFGTPMSHGCVNMPTPDAQFLYNWAPIGTPVRVQW